MSEMKPLKPTPYLRHHIVSPGPPSFRLRQWWQNESGQGEWRGIDAKTVGEEGWDAPPTDDSFMVIA